MSRVFRHDFPGYGVSGTRYLSLRDDTALSSCVRASVIANAAHRRLNQSELGKRAKRNAAHISQIETGARTASVPTLVALGKALDVPWNWLNPAR